MIPNKINNIWILALFFSEATAGSINVLPYASSLSQEPGEAKGIPILSPSWKHSMAEMKRQQHPVNTVFAPCEKMFASLCGYKCILNSEEIWSYQSTMTSAVNKMGAEWLTSLMDFLKVHFCSSSNIACMTVCAMLRTLLEQVLTDSSQTKAL